jgi:hypothetical protein
MSVIIAQPFLVSDKEQGDGDPVSRTLELG